MNAKRIYAIVGAGKLRTTETEFCKRFHALERKHSRDAYALFIALDELLETYGIEEIDQNETKNGCYISYLNVGDPYVPTLVYCNAWVHSIKLTSAGWGEYVES